MQFLESTNFFVRTVNYDFVNRNESIQLKFKLTPMIHIGTKAYYQQVLDNLKGCDEIFYEGNYLKQSRLLTRQYKWVAEHLGLVTQQEHFNLMELGALLTHADYDADAAEEAWRKLKFLEKIKLICKRPLSFFIASQGITREWLAKNYMTGSFENYLAYGPLENEEGTIENLIMNGREQIVYNRIRESMESEAGLNKVIAIVYGAGHMKSIARYLIDTYHFVPRSGQFMKAFDV